MDKITEAIDFLNIIKVTDKIWFRWIRAKEKLMNAREDFKELEEKCERLKKALTLAHTELTEIPDWPDLEHDHYVSETIEAALKENDDE